MAILLGQPRLGFTFGFQDQLRPYLVAILDGFKFEGYVEFGYRIPIDIRNYVKYNNFVIMSSITSQCDFENSQTLTQEKPLALRMITLYITL